MDARTCGQVQWECALLWVCLCVGMSVGICALAVSRGMHVREREISPWACVDGPYHWGGDKEGCLWVCVMLCVPQHVFMCRPESHWYPARPCLVLCGHPTGWQAITREPSMTPFWGFSSLDHVLGFCEDLRIIPVITHTQEVRTNSAIKRMN